MRKITKIKANNKEPVRRLRVAAYARVSSGKDAMLHSLSAQVSYYNGYIAKRMDWQFAGIYADEAITGTKDSRPEFQRLLKDCRAKKIDMVITKSITRFARNTVTLLETARELKLLGIDTFFEKENIHTLSADGEFMLTLLASFAQEESRSASENQKWRIKRMFEDGQPNTGNMLGYRLIDGKLHIVPEEAEIVRQIFTDYLAGMGVIAIMKKLNGSNIFTINGKKWATGTIHKILCNEKYTGDMLLQKTYVLDHISKISMRNHGERTMYRVENSHEAIIGKDSFNLVQDELQRRKQKYNQGKQPRQIYPFTGLIRCGLCGGIYRRKIAHINSNYEKTVWICETFNIQSKTMCPSQQIPESILIQKTMELLDMPEFDEGVLRQQICEIQVPQHNKLTYIFTDGHTQTVDWQNPSRRESWTEEMRQVARERQAELLKRRKEK